jgi:hypothetical protein
MMLIECPPLYNYASVAIVRRRCQIPSLEIRRSAGQVRFLLLQWLWREEAPEEAAQGTHPVRQVIELEPHKKGYRQYTQMLNQKLEELQQEEIAVK